MDFQRYNTYLDIFLGHAHFRYKADNLLCFLIKFFTLFLKADQAASLNCPNTKLQFRSDERILICGSTKIPYFNFASLLLGNFFFMYIILSRFLGKPFDNDFYQVHGNVKGWMKNIFRFYFRNVVSNLCARDKVGHFFLV